MLKIPNHLIVASSSWLSKIIIAGVQIISISYLIPLLGEDKYAVFSLLTGLLAWCTLVDLGVGNSLQNYISESRVNKESYDGLIKASIQLVVLSLIFFILFFYISSDFLSSLYLSSFGTIIDHENRNSFFIASVIFSIIGIGTVSYKILFSEFLGWKANIYNAISYILGLLSVVFILKYGIYTNVSGALMALYAPVGAISLCYLIYRYAKISHVKVDVKYYVIITKRSIGFLFFAFLSMLVLQVDYIVISQRLSPSDIVKYTIMMKIFSLVFFIYSAVLQALWPVCAELRVKCEWKRLNKIIIINIVFGIIFICLSTTFIYLFKAKIFNLIAKEINYALSFEVLILLAIYFCIRVWTDTYAMLLQSMNHLKILWFFVPFQAGISILSQWYLSKNLGINGILLGLIFSFLLTVFWGLPLAYKNKIKQVKNA
ncbi:MATE family efflux transporter [Xenorhabdus indica]|uniref:MATE family efflux transporter n=1 Tax=Xenorhabdus indica TaxID=333964 RepID=UPI0016572F87|nr:MATE family efflux transporter [Xenorhabdus indica]MBC8945598.1 LPS side chain defect: putative O-antigen transferase [Xenorhabdus indica]MBC8945767.1 LPS side chain defect: putative O-antigen transferase [Xenorhabdus indica]